jgi:hypothetical protein
MLRDGRNFRGNPAAAVNEMLLHAGEQTWQPASRGETLRPSPAPITIDGAHDTFTPSGNGSAYRDKFTGNHEHRIFDAGHNVPQEVLSALARAVVDVDQWA